MVFIPIGDDNSDRRIVPWVNYALIAMNLFVFLVFQQGGENEPFTYAYSVVPEEILTGKDITTPPETTTDPFTRQKVVISPGLQPTPLTPYLTLLTSMFMHGGWMHLLGNLLFLYVFGDNVEDHLGHLRYLLFYLLCGLIGSLAHVASSSMLQKDLLIPCLGASGAISGVLAGYVLLHPHRRVTVLIFRLITDLPAYVVIGIWFAFQFISSLMAISESGGGVAYGAHIGGFIGGAGLIYFMSRRW